MKIIKSIPNTVSLLLMIMIIFIILTWIIPAGEYVRETQQINGITKDVIIENSYHYVESSPQGIIAFLLAPIKGFISAAQIIGFCLFVGGAFGIFNYTGAINAGLSNVINFCREKPKYQKFVVPMIMVLFSLAGATFGMSESVLVFIMITIPLSLALGYDSIVGISMSFLAAGVGFAGALFNPFTIGIAQGIAEIPIFSGWEYRLIIWVTLTATAIFFVMRYIGKITKNPEYSPVYQIDKKRNPKEHIDVENQDFTFKRKAVLIILLFTFVLLIVGSNNWHWYINEISALFIGAGILVTFVYGISSKEAVDAFMLGAKDMIMAALIIGLSKGLLIIASDGKIIDTMLHTMAESTQGLSTVITAQLMFVFQGALNFFVPSGSGQAALSMPIMAPLSDLVGVSRQTTVLAYQLGDGIFNMIIPTSGVTMGVLSIAKIPYQIWFKWVLPFIIVLFVMSLLFLIPPSVLFSY
ncbi:MAG: C4-dicarboxylate ABC transporter [Bacteroidetes bacterium 4572_77]|nr:MAG: C4-dicarboxylate ABC transporter [Bacteroidetes bacterium 4572_77]